MVDAKMSAPTVISLGRYELRTKLGAGGMGEVYLAQDTQLGRLAALKLFPTSCAPNGDRLRRFAQEGRVVSALNHPNIVTIYEVGQVDSTHYIATEFVDGETLRRCLTRGRIDISRVVNIARQITEALVAAHAVGVVHRDIKPENVMVRPDGYVKVLDFGLAKLLQDGASGPAGPEVSTATNIDTESGAILGTLAYMSPEQLRGRQVDGRTDIWSVGVILYEMLAGHLPFDRSTKSDLIASILEREPPSLTLHEPGVPNGLQRIVAKALCKDKEQRYQTAQALLTELTLLGRELEFSTSPNHTKVTAASTAGVILESIGQMRGESTERASLESSARGAGQPVRGVTLHALGALTLCVVLGVAFTGLVLQQKGFGAWERLEDPLRNMQFTRLVTTRRVTGAAISPDGKYVAMVVVDAGRQSILVRQVATSSDMKIVGPSESRYEGIIYSPDGDYVYYLHQEGGTRTLFRVPALGGSPRKLVVNVNTSITFSPDGRQFAFLRKRGKTAALIVAGLDGAEEREVVTGTAGWKGFRIIGDLNNGPAWSPDGEVIACPTAAEDDPFHMNIAAVQVSDGTVRLINSQPWYLIGQIAWLPDGSGLITNAERNAPPSNSFQLWLLPYPSGEPRRLTNDLNFYRTVSLTADGRSLLTTQTNDVSSLWLVSGDRTPHADHVAASQNKGTGGITWRHDGSIVYASNETGNQNIWSMNADGGNAKQLTFDEHANAEPVATSDGQHVVFVSYRTGTAHVWRMNPDGTGQRQLTFGQYEDWPQVSPDSRWIVYHSEESSRDSIWKMPIDGGEAVKLTHAHAKHPLISPDGKLLAYLAQDKQANSQWRLTVIPFNGGTPIKTFYIPPVVGKQWHGPRWTPDGQALTYIVTGGGISNIWHQALSGGQPRKLTDFKEGEIYAFAWSPTDQSQLSCVRTTITTDLFLVRNFK
jgi:Tol biopolymer transport system component